MAQNERYERPFTLLSADQSLRRPGFALLRCDPGAGFVSPVSVWHLASKSSMPVGAALSRIYYALSDASCGVDVLVREKGFSRFARETQALYKVFGVADLAAWNCDEKTFDEIAPLSIKKLLTGSGKASKADVAAALQIYVGIREYACDDESDAVAAGIAWLIHNNYLEVSK